MTTDVTPDALAHQPVFPQTPSVRVAPFGGTGTGGADEAGALEITRVPLARSRPFGGPGTSRTSGLEEVGQARRLRPGTER